MRKHYPELCAWTGVQKTGLDEAEITNEISGNSFHVENADSYIWFVRQLDGRTNPYEISASYSRGDVNQILNDLIECGLIRESRWLIKEFGVWLYTLFVFREQPKNKNLFIILNKIIYLSFLPILAFGLIYFWQCNVQLKYMSIPGIISGILLGCFLHECSHAIASLSYGGKIFEIGAFLKCYILPGAYVITKENKKIDRIKKVQFYGAGIEMNSILAGIAFFLSAELPPCTEFFFMFGFVNIGMVFLNLAFIDNLDGLRILSALFGENDDLLEVAKETTGFRHKRSKLLEQGAVGKIILYSYYLVLSLQIAAPALFIVQIFEVISWFH